ncbi:TonB-dependent receptor plug domain-containing protein, partial [Flavitalea flava]
MRKFRTLLLPAVFFSLFLGSPFLSLAQKPVQTIQGKVRDADNNPVAGASITLKGSKKGTTTDNKGEFTIKDSTPDAILLISYQGYDEETVPVNGQSFVSVVLKRHIGKLEDVVVVGYGTQRRAATTGSIASVKAAELTQTPVTNVAQGIQARVSGVQITQNNAAPGGNISVRIRGTNSINGSSEPLYIIDGIQISNGGSVTDPSPLSTINPNDIESVEILKDASATAIYGARGANGVILITTKRGKNGPTRVQIESYQGVQNALKKIDMLNAAQFAKLENDVYNSPIYSNPDSLQGKGVNWQDLILRKAIIQNYQISVSGGSEKTQFSLSGNFFNQDGII